MNPQFPNYAVERGKAYYQMQLSYGRKNITIFSSCFKTMYQNPHVKINNFSFIVLIMKSIKNITTYQYILFFLYNPWTLQTYLSRKVRNLNARFKFLVNKWYLILVNKNVFINYNSRYIRHVFYSYQQIHTMPNMTLKMISTDICIRCMYAIL